MTTDGGTAVAPRGSVVWLATPIARPVVALTGPAVTLFLTSTVILFVELLLIRWIPANVTFLGFFRNFLLMASFLGIGAGILFGKDRNRIPLSPFVPTFAAMIALVGTATFEISVKTDQEIFFGLSESQGPAVEFLVLGVLIVLVSIIMASLALPLGRLLTSMPPLRAYAVDILGSMTGIAAFTVLSGLETPPQVWFAVVAVLLALIALGAGVTRWAVFEGLVLIAAIVLSVLQQPPGTAWSPYYRVSEHMAGPILTLNVNGIGHQALYPADYPKEPFYDQVYRWFPDRAFGSVLIVGAGSGTDVAVALRHGATHIDAVEIDPYLLDVGVRKHPDRPYDDPRVSRWIDDGRSFLRRSSDRYDLVVFALPDSLTLVSTSANIRLESFLFTSEAFASVRDHLAPGGVFVLYNYYRQPWLVQKMGAMLANAFGGRVLIRGYVQYIADAAILAAGPAVDELGGAPPPGDAVDAISLADPPRPATDDWPFLYLKEPSIPAHYLVALGLLLAWAVALVGRGARRSGTQLRRFSPHFFVLGVAFLLLETRSIVTFSLLFGSTWLVNALVFFAVLASVLLAIGVASRLPRGRSSIFYVPLIGAIVVAFLVPPASLLIEPVWLRYLVAGTIAFAPIFCANLVFSASFRDTRTADMAFASNLLGAMVGGAVEYLALVTGYQALLVVVGFLYLAAYAFVRLRLLGDSDIEVGLPLQAASPAPTGSTLS